MKETLQDIIDDYLLGRMPERERRTFEEEVAKNDELRRQLDHTRKIQDAIKSRNEKLAAMSAWEETYAQEQQATTRLASRKRLIYWISGIAAVFIAGILVFRNLTPREPAKKELAQEVSIKQEEPGVSHKDDSDYHEIYTSLQKKDFEAAKHASDRELQKLLPKGTKKGISPRQLIELRRRYDELRWLKVQALVGLDRRGEALWLLYKLRLSNSDYRQPADSLYHLMMDKSVE